MFRIRAGLEAMTLLLIGSAAMPANGADHAEPRRKAETAGIAGLPYASGRSFPTLDAYLAYLEKYAAPMDRPWYRQVRPGLYVRETGNMRPAPAAKKLFTREELERSFGFRR